MAYPQIDPISTLITGVPQATDLIPATDTQDTSQAASGTTKKYVRSAEFDFYFNAVGIKTIASVFLATNTPLTAIYNNGIAGIGATLTNNSTLGLLIIDGINTVIGERILVWQQTSSQQNGIYTVTNVGTSVTPWVLTRAIDYDNSAQVIQYQIVLVQQGNTLAGISFQETAAGPFVIGTSAIIFQQFDILNSSTVIFPLWISITSPATTMMAGKSYIANNPSSTVAFSLPTIANVGTTLQIAMGRSNSWSIVQNAGQFIQVGNIVSTTGITGSWASSSDGDSVSLVCTVADTVWSAYGSIGNLIYT
jgi:hypothetical protein